MTKVYITPEQVMRKEYGDSVNFMTPTIHRRAAIIPNKLYYELSEGTGFNNNELWGVSVVEVLKIQPLMTKKRTDLSKPFQSQIEAQNYIKYLYTTPLE